MANTSLTPELARLAGELAGAFAESQPVIAAKARIGLFYQNAEATDLFRKVNEYGEKLRHKHMEGMPPSEEEISHFDSLRQAVVDNPLCSGFLEARQQLDEMLSTVNQYLCLAIDLGKAPSDEEVADAMQQQVSCSCGGEGHGHCHDCGNDCHCGEGEHECHCGEQGHECCGGESDHKCRCGRH